MNDPIDKPTMLADLKRASDLLAWVGSDDAQESAADLNAIIEQGGPVTIERQVVGLSRTKCYMAARALQKLAAENRDAAVKLRADQFMGAAGNCETLAEYYDEIAQALELIDNSGQGDSWNTPVVLCADDQEAMVR